MSLRPFSTAARRSLACGLTLFSLLPACRTGPTPTTNRSKETGQLVLVLSPKHASVVLDEKPLLVPRSDGSVALGMPVGSHRLEIFAPGYFTAYREVQLAAGSPVTVEVALRADPDAAQDTAPARPFGPRPAALDPP
jgi:hypothetical protein